MVFKKHTRLEHSETYERVHAGSMRDHAIFYSPDFSVEMLFVWTTYHDAKVSVRYMF